MCRKINIEHSINRLISDIHSLTSKFNTIEVLSYDHGALRTLEKLADDLKRLEKCHNAGCGGAALDRFFKEYTFDNDKE